MILLLRRARVRSIILVAVASLLTGLVVTALGEDSEDAVVVGVSEPLWHYLQPYYEGFSDQYSGAALEFVVLDDSSAGASGDMPAVDTLIVAEGDILAMRGGGALQGGDLWTGGMVWPGQVEAGVGEESATKEVGAEEVGAEEVFGTVVESFDARFVPAVSAFNPTEEISLEVLRMLVAGELDDWSSVQPGWAGRIELVTWTHNSTDEMILNLLGDMSHYKSSRIDLESYEDLLTRLRFDPYGIALLPLSRIAPGVNPVAIIDGYGETGSQLMCRVHVLEPVHRSLPSLVRRWIATRLGRSGIIHKFIDYVRQMDASLSGVGATTLVAVGDVMLDRGVRLAMNEYGMTHPFEGTHQVLSAADLAVANLETPISNRGTPLNMFRAYPDVMKALRYSGIDVVSVANNHILDYDEIALSDTLGYLRTNGILSVGAGFDLEQARRPAVLEVGGTRSTFLAYTELWFCQTKDNRRYDATEFGAGVAPLREEIVIADVARAAAYSSFVVVSCHWGEEYESYPNETQRRFAQTAVDAGASVVLGHHPHVLQGLEFGDRSVTAYSLGNFVFDQRQPGTQDSMILRFTISGGRIIRLDVLPCHITDCQPILLSGEAKRRALLEIHRLSAGIAE